MNDNFIDIISILSFVIGVENLNLNTEQVKNLDEHLKQQDSILKEEQNKMLEIILEKLNEIIFLLKGESNA